MSSISYIDLDTNPSPAIFPIIPTDESVGAMLFDISGFSNPFVGYPELTRYFADNQVQCVNSLEDASLLGITSDSGFLNGMLYYHLQQFYDFIGGKQDVYILIADCSQNWDAIGQLQRDVNGKIFQVGIWTSQPIFELKADGKVGFSPLLGKLNSQSNEINGQLGIATHTFTPLSIILFGNSSYIEGGGVIDYKTLPDAMELGFPKISIVLAQNGTEEVHRIQNSNPLNAPVNALGIVMACLALCGAEESIASTDIGDLNKNEKFNHPELGFGANHTPIASINHVWANILSSRGYIIPVSYEELEASYFLSSDQTLREGDFSSIANNRVMHKCRRALCTALLPHLHGNLIFNLSTKQISDASMSFIAGNIYASIDVAMRNKQGDSQINGRSVTFLDNDDMLTNDALSLRLDILPANYSKFISEEVAHEVS